MDNAKFSIRAACRTAFGFFAREWEYLLKAGLPPILAQFATGVFLQFQRQDAGLIETSLWNLPATLLFSWFVFLTARRALLGEKLDNLPADPAYLRDRQQAMSAAVLMGALFSLCFSLGWMVMLVLLYNNQNNPHPTNGIGAMLVMGAMFWGLRFIVAPVLAAVHHPVRPVIRLTWGLLFSLRILGLILLAGLPPFTVFSMLVTACLRFNHPDVTVPSQITLQTPEILFFVALNALLWWAITALVTGALVAALRQILGTRARGVLA